MNRKRNDATLSKLGDIYQYYIALLDCFELKPEEKIQIELRGDVTLISNVTNRSFQKEVKHHTGDSKLSDRDQDLWNTLRNWIIDYKDSMEFSQLILFTTANIPNSSVFNDWNTKDKNQKYDILFKIGEKSKKNEESFRPCYNDIFNNGVLTKEQVCEVLDKFTIDETEGHYAVVFRKEDHVRLRNTLAGCKGKWMVSYNDCEYIRELYQGFYILSVTRINNLAQRYDSGCEYPEVIITNYDPRERQNSEPRQMNLFYDENGDDEDEFYRTDEMGKEAY